MSGYEYAYNISPARPTGWRSILAGCVTVVTVVAVSGISGAVVTLELVAPKPPPTDWVPAVAASSGEATGATGYAAAITPASSAPASMQPIAQQDHKPDQALRTALAPVPLPVPAPAQLRPAVATAPQANAPAPVGKSARGVPDSDLTFARGYAQRHAAQEAAADNSKTAAVSQLGRAAAPRKPAYARNNVAPDPRRLARGDATGYYDRPYGFDFRRHEALAYGEEQRPRRPEPRGFFGGMF
jgi:hypothetical protein